MKQKHVKIHSLHRSYLSEKLAIFVQVSELINIERTFLISANIINAINTKVQNVVSNQLTQN